MPKAILEYNLDESEDRDAHLRAVKSLSLTLSLWEIDQYLRAEMKYGELSNEAYEATEKARIKLREILDDNGISLDELMR